jgi:hypothetical protein
MAFLFRPGGPQVGAARAAARLAGVMATVVPGAEPGDRIPTIPDQARLSERNATSTAICSRGRAQHDRGRRNA